MKRLIPMILLLSLTLTASVAVLSGAEGSETKGKYYYKKTCKPCHKKDSEGPELSPLSKTTAQWESIFASGKHTDKQKLIDVMDEKQLLDVSTYLKAHASDSPQPETCGE